VKPLVSGYVVLHLFLADPRTGRQLSTYDHDPYPTRRECEKKVAAAARELESSRDVKEVKGNAKDGYAVLDSAGYRSRLCVGRLTIAEA